MFASLISLPYVILVEQKIEIDKMNEILEERIARTLKNFVKICVISFA